jgi:type I restriction enzyme S subunit
MSNIRLNEYLIEITKGTTPTTIGGEFLDEGVNFIKAECLNTGRVIDKKSLSYISQDIHNKLNRSILKEEDLLFSIAGHLGKMAIVRKNDLPANTNQAVAILRIDKTKADFEFLYYYLSSKLFSKFINSQCAQSVQPNINLGQLGELPIVEFPLAYQKKISCVLSVLDSKIELNNSIGIELESMAKTLYDYWFVQFDFPNEKDMPYKTSGGKMVWNEDLKREIPERWEVNNLGDLGNFKNGVNYDPSNPGDVACPIINVRNISSSTYFLKNEDLDIIYLRNTDVKKYAVHNGSIIIARSGIPGATRLIADIAENTLYCGFAIHYELENLDYKIPVFFYLKSIEYQIQNGSGGTIMKNVNQMTLNALNVSLPRDKGLLLAFNNLIQPIFDKISLIQNENQKLTELRDWLLPMLMNGQVKVN